MTSNLNLIEKHFPFQQFRDGQLEAIEAILKAFENGKKFVILEGPTGSGKSAIGMTIARHYNTAYYLTVQKILQDQLIKDFGINGDMKALKGRNSYKCNYWETYMTKYNDNPVKMKIMERLATDPLIGNTMSNPYLACDKGVCKVKDKTSACGLCFPSGFNQYKQSTCPYWKAYGEAVEADICLMNFQSFLFQTNVSDLFGTRDLMIIDEAHNTESQLMDFISLSLTDRKLDKWNIKFPLYDTADQYAEYFDSIELHEKIADIVRAAQFANNSREEEEWKKILLSYKHFQIGIQSGDWVPKWEDKGGYRKVTLKPIYVDKQAENYLFNHADRVLLMSATILQPKVMYDALGIDPKTAYAYRMKNRFDASNRPIYFQPSGSMSWKNKDETIPTLLKDIEKISTTHQEHKGIIHTHNFSIAKYVMENSKQKLRKRLFFQMDYETKDEMLEAHKNSENGIIIAPAMHEGLDLKGELSRFQIICKVPYPSFVDNEQLKLRMQLNQEYYNWLTALKLVQSYGRSIRSKNDWANTYILDKDFYSFRIRCQKLLPGWFKEAIQT